MTGGQPKIGKYPSGSKPLQIQGSGMELEIVSLSATLAAEILIGSERLWSRPSHSRYGRLLKNTLVTTPLVPTSFAPSYKSRNRSTLPLFTRLSNTCKKIGSQINPDKTLKTSVTRSKMARRISRTGSDPVDRGGRQGEGVDCFEIMPLLYLGLYSDSCLAWASTKSGLPEKLFFPLFRS